MRIKFVASMIVPCNCQILFELPWALATFPDVFLSLAVGHTEHLPGYKMVQLDFKKRTTRKKQYMCQMMIILCQWDFNEQTKKWVKLLLYTSKNCSRKFHTRVHFVSSQ